MPVALLPLVIGPAILLPLAIYALRHRRVRGATWYCTLLVAIALWSAAYAWELAAVDFAGKFLALKIKYLGVTALPVAWIGFVLDFVARERTEVRRTTRRLSVVAVAVLFAAWTNQWHELFWGPLTLEPVGRLYTFTGRGPGFWLNIIYTYSVLFGGLAILVAQAIQSPYLYRKRTIILVLATVVPWLGNVVFVSRLEGAGTIDSTPFLFTCTAIIAAVAVFRYRVLEPIPTLLDARIEVIGDGLLIVDRSLRVADLNRAAEAIIGRDRAAAAGEPIERVLPDWPPTIADEVRQDLTLAAADGSHVYDVRITPIQSSGHQTGYVVLLRDVTDRRRAETALRDSELRYRELVENARDLICTCDLDGRILAINQAGLHMIGYTSEELLGRPILDLVALESRERAAAVFTGVRADAPEAATEVSVLTRDGHALVLELASWPQCVDGSPIAVQAIGRDITERRRLEEDLRHAQKMESVGKLAGGIAHDFNNLLTAIIGYAALAEPELEQGTPLHEWIEQIRRSGEQAAALTGQLLAFGRRQMLRPIDLDLNVVVDDIHKMLRRLIGERIELVVTLAPDLTRVRVDRSQVEQVIVNLVVNARDAMPRGGRLTIRTHNVEIGPKPNGATQSPTAGAYAALTVDDTGEGIAPEILERIFEPFFTTKPLGRGTGLGLATVYGVVKQSGGDVVVESAPAQGARFTVLLPAASATTDAVDASRDVTSHAHGAVLTPKGATVLIVEDDAGVRSFAAQVLRDAGSIVLEAGNPAEALAIAARESKPLDLLLSDVVLPGIDGPDLATRLRALRPGLRVLFMSGYTPEEIVVTAALASEDLLLRKPFLPASLRDRVARVLTQPSGISA